MHGKPKHLNSKADYLYIKDNFPASFWMPHWQELLGSRFFWKDIETTLSNDDAGINDDTHRVVESSDDSDNMVRIQQELAEDPGAKLYRIGFTVAEVSKALS